jgi:hypothetical protein
LFKLDFDLTTCTSANVQQMLCGYLLCWLLCNPKSGHAQQKQTLQQQQQQQQQQQVSPPTMHVGCGTTVAAPFATSIAT